MKKWTLSIGVILLVILIWSTFQKTTDTSKHELQAKDVKDNTVVFTVPVIDMNRKIPFEILADDYNRMNEKQIVIEKILEEDYQKILNMKMLQGNAPDMFIIEEDWVRVFDQKGWLASSATPLSVESYRFICNFDLFERAGISSEKGIQSIEDVYTVGSRINDLSMGIVYGFVPYLNSDKQGLVGLIERIGKGNGFYHFDPDKGMYDFSIYENWIQMMVTMQNESIISENFLDIRKEVALNQFESGIVGMLIVSSQDMYWLKEDTVSDSEIFSIPVIDSKNEIGLSSMFFGVYSQSDHITECVEFFDIITSIESEQNIYEQGYYIPLRHYGRLIGSGISAGHHLDEFLVDDFKDTSYWEPLFIDETGIRFNVYKQVFEGELSVVEGLDKLSHVFNEMVE